MAQLYNNTTFKYNFNTQKNTEICLPLDKNNIFIRRHNTNNAGNNRYIINENDFIKNLDNFNFIYYYFEDYKLEDKIINLLKLKPKLIIGMGGYSSVGVCLAGFFLKIPFCSA